MTNIQRYSANDVMPFTGQAPLRRDWVARIFEVLSSAFGKQFDDKWEGVNTRHMQDLWAAKLAQFFDQPQAIKGALEEACEQKFPPNLGEFYLMCQRRYHYERPAVDVEPPGYAEWKAAQGGEMEDRESVVQKLNEFLKRGQ